MPPFKRIVVVTRKTALQELLERFVTEAQARFYLEHMGLSFAEYEQVHRLYAAAMDRLLAALPPAPRHQVIDRSFLPTYTFDERDLVVTLGNNGLVVNAAKYVDGQPILGVNVDPVREDGVVAPFGLDGVGHRIAAVLRGEYRVRPVTMAEATLNDGQRLLAFNDLFIGHRGHQSARYRIEFAGRAEDHSSSGVIVATGAGSTAWITSVLVGSLGIVRAFWPGTRGLPATADPRFDWSADELRFVVREPWPSRRSQAGLVAGTIVPGTALRLTSLMPEGGVIFSDGIEADAVAFDSGAIAEVRLAGRKANLIAA